MIHVSLIYDLQTTHDARLNWTSSNNLQNALASAAIKHGLNPSILRTLDWSAIGR